MKGASKLWIGTFTIYGIEPEIRLGSGPKLPGSVYDETSENYKGIIT
jgi:hypothetical protein